MKIGLIGCGRMGAAMAARLGETGAAPLCWDISAEARARVAEAGAPVASSPQAVAEALETVIRSLPNAAAVKEAMAAVDPALPPEAIVVDTTTSEPGVSLALAAAGWRFIDTAVSSALTGARLGSMTMLVGGGKGALSLARHDLDRLAAKIVDVSDAGAGHAAKIANNMPCAANLSLVAEA